jgi:hypothetical protein
MLAREVCGGPVRPQHGIGARNGVKALQGLALPVRVSGKAIRMPAFD